MNKAWKTYTEALFRRMPSLRNTLGKGASEDEIRAAEEEIGIVFPEMLRTLYLDNNGDTGESVCGMMLGFGFYDLDFSATAGSRLTAPCCARPCARCAT